MKIRTMKDAVPWNMRGSFLILLRSEKDQQVMRVLETQLQHHVGAFATFPLKKCCRRVALKHWCLVETWSKINLKPQMSKNLMHRVPSLPSRFSRYIFH